MGWPRRWALAEGFAAAARDLARSEALGAHDYPRCAVPLGPTTVAIAASFPEDDAEALHAWAARVAKAASRAGVHSVLLAPGGAGRAALSEALGLIGIAVDDADEHDRGLAAFFRFPWRPRARARRRP
jgi:hypothetical protein